MTDKHIIVIDDEVNICRSIKACLLPEGYIVSDFCDAQLALKSMQTHDYDMAIIDIRLGQQCGIELFKQMRSENLVMPVIFISGNASLNEAAQTLKLGAFDFLEKPFNADKLSITVKNCVDFSLLKNRVKSLEQAQQDDQLLGEHSSMKQLRKSINKVAQTDAAILISGESGTGKELIAQSIHQQSRRASKDLVKVNCSAIPENLIESALFGHVKGAFTGAEQHKKGYFEMAHKGTLFLDEIGDMPLASQASLLRVLESKEIQKVGSDKITKVDVRLLAASHKDLKLKVQQGEFREDLFYRINVIPIQSPSLRERQSDIPLLVNHFIGYLSKRNGFANKSIDPKCYSILSQYSWPGNVRELLNTIERMLIMGDDKLLISDIPDEISSKPNTIIDDELSLKEFRHNMERALLIKKLKQYKGNITHVAKSLVIDRTYLYKKLTQYNIKRNQNFD
ncbi:sigma-54 dependent transcriptional regulator [Pseudoalteromonas sp. C2R02]|uniref:sigma-54-dependent transcriptional regulator n=1 Tax=Pseudoalteromonas sp. C2R02 TaxID=2841565 RepID=UPI001C0900EF|nr:sigma-54 dependent transcriptional regulator [Pseudoalteromonas sp. C2R02]MBU2972088.1 sigma-54 dependent transcriptional regulator [Pseudoalteromonas sp. C2R02]